jgi:hypothetical protein
MLRPLAEIRRVKSDCSLTGHFCVDPDQFGTFTGILR